MRDELLRPITGIENRTPQEVFEIMCDRIKYTSHSADPSPDTMQVWWKAYRGFLSNRTLPGLDDEEGHDSAAAIIAQAKAKWQAEAFEMAAQTAESYPSMDGADIPVVRGIAHAIRALKDT